EDDPAHRRRERSERRPCTAGRTTATQVRPRPRGDGAPQRVPRGGVGCRTAFTRWKQVGNAATVPWPGMLASDPPSPTGARDDGRACFVGRVWVPDRPGALGQVASRIGAVGGDVLGIEVIDRGGGRAVDELTIQLVPAHVELLIREVNAVDGVDVEELREV